MAEPFIGEIRIFTYNFPPYSWAYCDGQVLSVGENPALFSVISDYWGGNGSTTFALPNLTGRAPMHSGQGPGLTNRLIAQMPGLDEVGLDESMLPTHSHLARAYRLAGEETAPQGHYLANVNGIAEYKDTPYTATEMSSSMVGNTGQNAYHSNLQPYLTLPFCIALEGMYPSRN